jgi:glycosyltransferase involved in cell wall biosynthesis
MSGTVVVVPCFNEADRLSLRAFREFVTGRTSLRVLFVDDGSTDNTYPLLETLAATAPASFGVIRMPRNVGKGEAVRRGILVALDSGADYVGFWDADLATPLEVIPLFEALLRDHPHVDIVMGARVRLLGHDIQRRAGRHYLGRIFATGVALVLGIAIYDSQCGAKLFRRTEPIKAVFAQPFRSRWIFDVEIVARFCQSRDEGPDRRTAIFEYPLPEWKDVAGSKLRAKDLVRALVDLWRIYLGLISSRRH